MGTTTGIEIARQRSATAARNAERRARQLRAAEMTCVRGGLLRLCGPAVHPAARATRA
jgi:hypothetical protein